MKNKKDVSENLMDTKGPKRSQIKKPKRVKFNPAKTGAKKNMIIISSAVLMVIVFSALIFTTLTSLFSTETYYVLNSNVRAKQKITSEMVTMRETAKGTGPVNSIEMEHIQRGVVYAKYPLYAGDVVAYSNAGPLSGQTLGIPDDWSVTSFSVSTDDAVGGILGKGDYADLLGVDPELGASYIFNNILILDVKFVDAQYDNTAGAESIVGETMHYTVGMPAKDIAYLHSALLEYKTIKIIKAPYSLNYAKRDVSDLDKAFKYGPEVGNIDIIAGTDPTFADVERDETGKPLKTIEHNREDNQDNQDNYKEEISYEDNKDIDHMEIEEITENN